MLTEIKFAASGWRAVVAERLTLPSGYQPNQRPPRNHGREATESKYPETPVGVNHIQELTIEDNTGRRRRRLAITSWNKDGILRGLLRSQAATRPGKSLADPWKTISYQVGSFFPQPENFRLTPEVKTKFTEKLENDPRKYCGHEVSAVVRKD